MVPFDANPGDVEPQRRVQRRGSSRRALWGLADQAFSSLTNFAVTAIVAHAVSPAEFGRFALVFSAYLLMLGLARAVFTLPLLVRFSDVPRDVWAEAVRSAAGSALAAGCVGGVACAVAASVLPASGTLLALAVTIPGLLLQDAWRHCFFASGASSAAFLNDLVWALTMIPCIWAITALQLVSAEWLLLAWGTAGTIAAVFGVLQTRIIPSASRSLGWIREHWDLSSRQLGEVIALAGSNQLVLYVAGIIGGVLTVGALRGAYVVMGPLMVALQGVWVVALPEVVRLLHRRNDAFVRTVVGLSMLLTLVGGAYLLTALLLGPVVGPILVGATWVSASTVLVPIALTVITTGAWMGATLGLRALQQNARSLRARITTSVLIVGAATVGVVLAGTVGAAWGLAIGNVAGVLVWWTQFASVAPRANRSRSTTRTDVQDLTVKESGA